MMMPAKIMKYPRTFSLITTSSGRIWNLYESYKGETKLMEVFTNTKEAEEAYHRIKNAYEQGFMDYFFTNGGTDDR
jgi:ABC-type glycerol-3-phosphate transport system substrate-binding protein